MKISKTCDKNEANKIITKKTVRLFSRLFELPQNCCFQNYKIVLMLISNLRKKSNYKKWGNEVKFKQILLHRHSMFRYAEHTYEFSLIRESPFFKRTKFC